MAPENDMNETFEETMADATVITVPIDATLSHANEAADAKAVGDALDLKADKSQVTSINVNGQSPDNQGTILIDGTDIPVSGTDTRKLDVAIAAAAGRTGADIPMSGSDPTTIQAAINTSTAKYATNIPMSDVEGAVTIATKINAMDNERAEQETQIGNLQDQLGTKAPMDGWKAVYNSNHQCYWELASGTRHLIMILCGSGAEYMGMWLVQCSNVGSVIAFEINRGSGITAVNTVYTTNRIRFTIPNEPTVRIYDINLTGAFEEEES